MKLDFTKQFVKRYKKLDRQSQGSNLVYARVEISSGANAKLKTIKFRF